MEGDRGDVTIANSGENGGGEEDRLYIVPADGIVMISSTDTSIDSFCKNYLIVTQ